MIDVPSESGPHRATGARSQGLRRPTAKRRVPEMNSSFRSPPPPPAGYSAGRHLRPKIPGGRCAETLVSTRDFFDEGLLRPRCNGVDHVRADVEE